MTGNQRSGRRGHRQARGGQARRAPIILRRLAIFSVFSEEGLSLIEANAERIRAETGMEFHGDDEILAIFAAAGCDVSGARVRIAPGFCRQTITATAPAILEQQARNPANNVQIGGDARVPCPTWGPPFVHDPDRGRGLYRRRGAIWHGPDRSAFPGV